MLYESFGFSREYVWEGMTIQQVKLYLHVADQSILRNARVQAIEVAKVMGFIKS